MIEKTNVMKTYELLKLIALITVSMVMQACSAEPAEWIMIDVKQGGQSNLIIDNGKVILIDVGTYAAGEQYVVPYLRSKGISKVDLVIVTHPHWDHVRGIEPIVDAGISIEEVHMNTPPPGVQDFAYDPLEFLPVKNKVAATGTRFIEVSRGRVYSTTNVRMEVLLALKSGSSRVNDYSLVHEVLINGTKVLLTGDIELIAGNRLLGNKRIESDLLQAPHHGVNPMPVNAFFDAVNPDVTMISSSELLWSLDRSQQIREWLSARSKLYCHTAFSGDIKVVFDTPLTYQVSSSERSCLLSMENREIPSKTDFSLVPILDLLLLQPD